MKYRKTVRAQVLFLVLAVSIPIYFIMLIISELIFQDMEARLIQEKRKSLDIYCSQVESELEDAVSYVYRILGKERWIGLWGEKGSVNYELAKTDLWIEISNMVEFFPCVSGFYVRINSTNDTFICYKSEWITSKDRVDIASWIKEKNDIDTWSILKLNGSEYFDFHCGNGYFEMGILANIESIYQGWLELADNEIDFYEEFVEKEDGKAVISETFLNQNIHVVYYVPDSEIRSHMPIQYYLILMVPISGIIICVIALVVLKKILNDPLKRIKDAILEIDSGNIDYRISKIDAALEFMDIEKSFNKMLDQIYDLKILAYDLELETQKTQYLNLRLQINPHFLLNSLNTIYGLAQLKKCEDIQSFVYDMVGYFQYVLRNDDEVVTLKKELEFVEHFVAVQKVRFPGRFYVFYDISEELYEELLPPLLVENFVENCVKHAMVRKKVLEIIVIVKKRDDYLIVSICDNGKGMSENIIKKIRNEEQIVDENGCHIGIWNCCRRLKLLYKEDMEFSVSSKEGEGTQIWIKIPCWKKQK